MLSSRRQQPIGLLMECDVMDGLYSHSELVLVVTIVGDWDGEWVVNKF